MDGNVRAWSPLQPVHWLIHHWTFSGLLTWTLHSYLWHDIFQIFPCTLPFIKHSIRHSGSGGLRLLRRALPSWDARKYEIVNLVLTVQYEQKDPTSLCTRAIPAILCLCTPAIRHPSIMFRVVPWILWALSLPSRNFDQEKYFCKVAIAVFYGLFELHACGIRYEILFRRNWMTQPHPFTLVIGLQST